MRDLLNILAVVLAALQLIPAYFLPKAQIPFLFLTIVGFGVFAFFYISFADKQQKGPIKWYQRSILVLSMVFGAVLGVGYKAYQLHEETVDLRGQLDAYGGAGPIRNYLEHVVAERNAQWNNEFEKRYARPTLYLLNNPGTREHSPISIQSQLLLWRIGTEGMSPEFKGIAGLIGESMNEETNEVQKVARGIANYVDKPLADSDILNKRTGESDDIPQRLLILGDPAAGKSSMLERLDLIQARRALGTKDQPIPVLIDLKGIPHLTTNLIYARVRARLGVAAEPILNTRKIVLILDALDETGNPAEAAGAIKEIASDPIWDRIIVACRLLNYSVQIHDHENALWRHNFVTAILYGLDQTAIEKQILTRATPTSRQKIFYKLARTDTRQAWLQFLRLPMDFDLVLNLIEESESEFLPRRQCDIIRGFVEKRFEHKNISVADAVDAQTVLCDIAVNLVKNGVATRSRSFTVNDALPSGGRNDSALLKRSNERIKQALKAGLLKDEGDNRLKFFHLNIQDYFTAKGLSAVDKIDPMDIGWRQILLFKAGLSSEDEVAHLVSTALERAKRNREEAGLEYLNKLLREIKEIQSSKASG